MSRLRLAAGLGFYGDSWLPVRAAIERGDVQYVCSDHLAELTLAILQKDRARDASLGWTRDVVPMLVELWPAARRAGVKFVLNAGGLNPPGARDALAQALRAGGEKARIAVVGGDAMQGRIDALRAAGETLAHLDSGASIDTVRDRLLFANVYLGAEPIAAALAQGADIVLTGRVADAALFLGPLLHHFDWPRDDWQRLAQGAAVGHLLECSGQASGGNFGSAGAWARVPDFTHIGYPIAEVADDGSATIGKAAGSGGRINFHTLRQQLLYEVHDPTRYITPDVVLDISTIELDDLGADRVRVRGASGRARPDTLKLIAGYDDGWMGHAVVGFCWPDALAKAQAVEQSIRTQVAERGLAHGELIAERIGHDTFLGPHADRANDAELNEVWLRMALRTPDRRVADAFPRLFPWLALSGPPYMGGFHGIAPASRLLGLWPTTVRRELVEPGITVDVADVA